MERTVKIAVCDDEEKYREDIVRFVAEHCVVRNVAYHIDTFASGRELAAPEGRMAGYDIIYLDINMAQMDGMEAARRLREESADTYLVFVTAFARFAAEGYRVDATRYVLKDALLKEGICESLDSSPPHKCIFSRFTDAFSVLLSRRIGVRVPSASTT